MAPRSSVLSTADARRTTVVSAALSEFALTGYWATTVAAIAQRAAISPAYVFKLFPGKEPLFVAALEQCFDQIVVALEEGAAAAATPTPGGVLDAMGGAYAELIADRRLLMLQVHAQSAAEVPEIGASLRRGLAKVTLFAKTRSGASDDEVQQFIAFGQLCHLIVTTGIENDDSAWAAILNRGIRHP
ncbi:TetR/AcrR family transcriptional regulator [Herbiconiux sp. CPCC 205763]|uniref:TetR/AcrR family transcriptional regulator n=1 Tax=Herbiconiux aconitum TaxID=2970913 RepID=A0ABT2GK02_9MICO|nr:helix-turn-helix domain-containing protein [Herbiconiux aconitum]MCS5716545.1 TetR/AcrR family transcriptional regulator [Herbiconiux aconitum]